MELSTRKRAWPPGYTLVEIMVSMVIALIVMGGVYRTLLDEDVNQQRSEMVLDMQNNARVALDRITSDIRRTGFLSCGGTMAVSNPLTNYGADATMIGRLTVDRVAVDAGDPPGVLRDMTHGSVLDQLIATAGGFDYLGEALGFNNDAPAGHAHYQAGTDAITLVYLADERAVDDANPMTAGTDDIRLTASGFEQDDILVASDCSAYSLFQKTNVLDTTEPFMVEHDGGLNTTDDLGRNYGQAALARVFRLTTETYFIHTGDYNLCHNAVNRAIASNIEDLQFEFLFDEDLDGNLSEEAWVTNLGAHTSKDVRAIRFWVLAMSEPDFGYTDSNTYDYPNSPYYSVANPFASTNGAGGSPAAVAPAGPPNGKNRHRFLASRVVKLRNAGLVLE